MKQKNTLFIFDMDNTLIHSQIDFALMKAETCRLVRAAGFVPEEALPVSQIIRSLDEQGQMPPELEEQIWQRMAEIEADGLAVATLEQGIIAVLEALYEQAHLVVLTNNNEGAALQILQQLGLTDYFSHIMGRGSAPQMKPLPGGMLALLARFPALTPHDTVAVGDATIDIRAATAADIGFAAYNGSRVEKWQERGFAPRLQLTAWDEQSAARLLRLAREWRQERA